MPNSSITVSFSPRGHQIVWLVRMIGNECRLFTHKLKIYHRSTDFSSTWTFLRRAMMHHKIKMVVVIVSGFEWFAIEAKWKRLKYRFLFSSVGRKLLCAHIAKRQPKFYLMRIYQMNGKLIRCVIKGWTTLEWNVTGWHFKNLFPCNWRRHKFTKNIGTKNTTRRFWICRELIQ